MKKHIWARFKLKFLDFTLIKTNWEIKYILSCIERKMSFMNQFFPTKKGLNFFYIIYRFISFEWYQPVIANTIMFYRE